jgi:hypothetical protein
MTVFVSHKTEDGAAYKSFCLALKGKGIEYWDASTMIPGRPLAEQLKTAIQECEACVFIATRRSIDAKWCLAELGAFWGAGKLVVVYVADPDVSDKDFPPQFKGTLWTDDPNRVIQAIQDYDPAEDMPELSGGMIYILRELALRGWGLKGLTSLWTQFNESQAETIDGYKTTKYACQCLEALGLASRFGGDEYTITKLGLRLLTSPSVQKKYKRAFLRKLSSG